MGHPIKQSDTTDVLEQAHRAGCRVEMREHRDTGALWFRVERAGGPTVYATLRTVGELRAWLEGVEYGRKLARREGNED